MRAGLMDRRITLQRKSSTPSSSGDPVVTWAALATVWANVSPVRGDERFTDPQYAAKEQTDFRIRYSSDVADLSPLDRILYQSATYDILAVHELGRRETLQIIAFRRADT